MSDEDERADEIDRAYDAYVEREYERYLKDMERTAFGGDLSDAEILRRALACDRRGRKYEAAEYWHQLEHRFRTDDRAEIIRLAAPSDEPWTPANHTTDSQPEPSEAPNA